MNEKTAIQNIGKTKQVALFIFGLFLVSMLIDPAGAFGVRNVVFGFLCVYLLFTFLSVNTFKIPVNVILIEGLIFVFAPAFFLFISVAVHNIPLGNVLREFVPFGIWLLYPILICIYPRNKAVSTFKNVMLFGACLIILSFALIYLFYLLGRLDLVSTINEFAREYRLGFFGQRPASDFFHGLFVPNVYFRWSLLLIPAAALFLKEKKIKLLIVISAVLLTFSTAIVFFTAIALVWVLVAELYKTKRFVYLGKYLVAITASIACVLVIFNFLGFGNILQYLIAGFSPYSPGVLIRIGHIQSIVSILLSDPWIFLFGMGVGSSFYSIGVNAIVYNVEVSHFNLVRQFGVLYASMFFGYIVWVFLKAYKTDSTGRALAIGLATLFIAAGTNPLLVSPVFFIVMVITRAYITVSAKELYNFENNWANTTKY